MKHVLGFTIAILSLLWFTSFYGSPVLASPLLQTQDTVQQNQQDTTPPPRPKTIVYENVDVIIDTEWGDHDVNRDVRCVIELKDGKPDNIVIYPKTLEGSGKSFRRCQIQLRKGVTVKIVDHKTRKVLRTIQP